MGKTRQTGNLVSSNNIFVDIANDRVGVGTTQPISKLNVIGEISVGSNTIINSLGQWVGSSAGIQGVQGTTGTQGTTGSQGIQGTTGSQGATGPQGITGSRGIQGTTGSQGANGTQGTIGTTGTQGTTGAQGTSGATVNTFPTDATNKANITTRTDSGFYEHDTATTGEGWPITSNTWMHLLAVTHSNDAIYYSMQIAGSFFNNTDFYYRSTNGSGSTGWAKIWNAANDGAGSGLDADLLDGLNATSTNTTSTIVSRDGSGNFSANNISAVSFITTSDENLKTNIHTLENAVEKLANVRGVSFDWKTDDTPSIGVIAQEIEKVFPAIVKENDGKKSVNYNGLIGVMIEAIKEQQTQINILKEEIENLKK